jgi:ABC-type dipeptide/oligopeptide/nickel transport system permease component
VRLPFIGRKLIQLFLTLLAVVTFNFLLFRVLPGDPIQLYARSGRLTPEAADQLRALFGLDKPVWEQFLIYLKGLLHGDMGFSLTYRRPVSDIIGERMVNTILLVGTATLIVVVVGVILGATAASKRGSKMDSSTVFGSLALWSMPTFWVGMLLVFTFGVWFQILPISGISSPGATYTTPRQVATYVRSATHSWFGRVAVNWRVTRSGGRVTTASGMVVRRNARPRTAPTSPSRRISRATVQRATATPSRSSCFQIFRTPYTSRCARHTRPMCSARLASRRARAGWRVGSWARALRV